MVSRRTISLPLEGRVVRVVCLLGLLFIAAGDLAANDRTWPGFQGPATSKLVSKDLPLTWSADSNVAWKLTVPGYGQSSPVIWDSLLIVTSISGTMKETCHVTAVDVESGKVAWQRSFPSATKVENTNYVSKAAPTPVVDGLGVIVFFEVGNLVALDHRGELRWTKNLVEEFGELPSRHGLGSSLVQTDRHVFVWIERQADPYLLAVDKETGKTHWKAPGLGAASWSTPALLPVASSTHLVLSGSGMLVGYDPETGKQLWSLKGLSGNSTPTPHPYRDGQFLLGATVGRGEEGGGKAAESNGLIRVGERSGTFEADFKWRCKRATSSFGSPIVHQGLAYFVNGTGVVFCVDVETGEEVYAERAADSIWATPLAIGDRIYLAGRSGTTTVIQSGREFRILAQNRLWNEIEPSTTKGDTGSERKEAAGNDQKQPVQYAIAAVPGHLFIRTGEAVFCIRQPVQGAR